MKKYLGALLLLNLLWMTPVSAQVITGFGTSKFNPMNLGSDLQGAWTNPGVGSQNSTSVSITGATNDFDGTSGIVVDLSQFSRSSVNIAGNLGQLTLTGTLNSATPGTDTFSIKLYDSSFNSLSYQFNWSSFAGGGANGVAVTANLLAPNPSFNGTVAFWTLNLFGISGDSPNTVGFTFDQLQAGPVPEPSTYALMALGLGVMGFCLYRRQTVVSL
jgi:hypothetical protein